MILEYTIQVILFQLAFLLVYDIFLKKETFFNYNRTYLLLSPVLALVLPLLKLEFLVEVVPQNVRINLPEVFIGNPEVSEKSFASAGIQDTDNFSLNWWYVAYFTGLGISFLLFLKKYNTLNRLFRFQKISEEKDFKIIEVPNSDMACTFFNTIFLGDQLSETEKQQILSHELVHVKQKHSLDLLFFEFLKIIFWFNPLMYIYQSRIAWLHEFIADKEVVKSTEKKTYYEQLLNTAFSTQNISFINQFFNHSLTRLTVFGRTFYFGSFGGQVKKRIVMLQKNKSSKLSKFKFLVVIPLMLIMLTYVACSEDNATNIQKEESSTSEIIAELKAHLENKETLTKEEKEQFLELLKKREELLIAEGHSKYLNKKPDNNMYDGKSEVPFGVIEKVPAFSGCENLEGEDRKDCTTQEISMFVNKNFDTSLGKQLGLTGVNRVIVQFRIDETGKIQDIKSRAAHPELEKEAERVIASIPQMQPGEQNGRPISVMYSLPIAFKVAE